VKKTLTILLFFCLTFGFVSGQLVRMPANTGIADGISEKISLFTDRNFYLSGEEVWFVAYIFVNEAPFISDFSQVLYVELSNSDQKAMVKTKFKISGGIAKGSFGIPEEALSGNYILRAYTLFLRNAPPEAFFTTTLLVINPERPLPENSQSPAIADSPDNAANTIEILVNSSKTIYSHRELAELNLSAKINSPTDFAHLSVSVVKQGLFPDAGKNLSNIATNQKAGTTENLLWLPEMRDVSLSGIIKNKKTKQPEANIKVYLSVLGAEPQFHITSSRENGEFVFPLNRTTNISDVFVCTDPDPENEFEILINNDFAGSFPATKETNLDIDTSYKKLIEEMLVNQQTGKAFLRKDTAKKEDFKGNPLIFGKPGISVLLKDFIELPTLEDVFKELVTSVSIKSRKEKSYLQVLSSETNRMNNCRFIFLDHVLVFDVDALLTIPPSKIERIEVINRTHYLGDFTLDGIIMITTNTDNFAGYIFPKESVFLEYQAITPTNGFEAPDYSNQEQKLSRMPDFRTLLYWNPDVEFKDGKAAISFYTSDHCSAYDVIVRGITTEGKSCFGKTTFRVEPAKK
jgi:hypothetical protein